MDGLAIPIVSSHMSRSTFLTQLDGSEDYDNPSKVPYDTGTSQSTLLLQKQKKMQEVQSELLRKKREFEKRMRKCDEKEKELAEKQQKIRESVVKFEKFVKVSTLRAMPPHYSDTRLGN